MFQFSFWIIVNSSELYRKIHLCFANILIKPEKGFIINQLLPLNISMFVEDSNYISLKFRINKMNNYTMYNYLVRK